MTQLKLTNTISALECFNVMYKQSVWNSLCAKPYLFVTQVNKLPVTISKFFEKISVRSSSLDFGILKTKFYNAFICLQVSVKV